MQVVTFGTHEYQWLIPPFAAMFQKYWGRDDKIIYFSDMQVADLPANVEFRRPPVLDERRMDTWNWLHNSVDDFGSGFVSALRTIDDPVVMVSLPDMWLVNHARLDRIDTLTEYMVQNSSWILRVLVGDVPNIVGVSSIGQHIDSCGDLDIRTISLSDTSHGMLGGCLLWPSLWNRQLAIGLLRESTIWSFEVLNTDMLKEHPDIKGTWTSKSMYPYAHTMSRNNTKRVMLSQEGGRGDIVLEEDLNIIRSLLPNDVEVLVR